MIRSLQYLKILIGLCLIAAVGPSRADEARDRPSAEARRMAPRIRQESLRPPRGPEGRPLPLVSHWNVGTVDGTFEPDHQIELLQQGYPVLPWMSWPSGDPQSKRFQAYYERLLKYFAQLNLPVSFRGTQWPAMLVKKKYRNGPKSQWAGVIAPDDKRISRLSPFGAIEPWKDPADEYVDTPAMKRAQEIFPDPPLVLWVSNNEPPDLRWAKNGPLEEKSKRYWERYGRGRSEEFKRRVVAQGWRKRYSVMFQAMQSALVDETWGQNVRFVGYGAFGPSHFGRWDGWKVYSLITDEWTSPDWHFWEGGSPSYYTHNWNDNRDHWVFSTQVQSMNWLFMLEEAWQVNPDFWFEMSTWDGNEVQAWKEGLGVENSENLAERSNRKLNEKKKKQIDEKLVKKSKALQYMMDGQTYPPERTAGWVQFGMWLLRPRVVREFRSHTTPLSPIKPYWMETVRAVDRVWNHESLREFWRHGKLVLNRDHRHPYQSDVPQKYREIPRWYLLDTNLDPERPWNQQTNLPAFSLALVRGEKGARNWLLYTHSPLKNRKDVQITLPNYGTVIVDVPRAGAFYRIEEATDSVKPVKTSS